MVNGEMTSKGTHGLLKDAAGGDQLSKLQNEIVQAKERSDYDLYVDKVIELLEVNLRSGSIEITKANYPLAYECFNSAYTILRDFENEAKMILHAIEKKDPENGDAAKNLNNLLHFIYKKKLFAEAHVSFCKAQSNRFQRNSSEAIKDFAKSSELFIKLYRLVEGNIFKLNSEHCLVLKTISEGMEEMARINFPNAISKFQLSKVQMENVIEKTLPKIKEECSEIYSMVSIGLKNDLNSIENLYYFSNFKLEFSKGNYIAAKEKAENLCDIFIQRIKPTLDELTENIKYLHLMDYYVYSSNKYLAEAQIYREQELWEDAFSHYDKAKSELTKAANSALKSSIPQSILYQETMLNTAALISETYIRDCKREMEMKKEIKSLKSNFQNLQGSLAAALKPAGVTVNTHQEMVATVEQNVQVIQKIENRVKDNIDDLISMLNQSEIDNAKKDEIKKNARDLLNSEYTGHKFLEKAKKFTEDVAKTVKNLGDITKPIIPAVKALSLLL